MQTVTTSRAGPFEFMSRSLSPTNLELSFSISEYVTSVKPIAFTLDRLQGDSFCHYGCLLPTLLAVRKNYNSLCIHCATHDPCC